MIPDTNVTVLPCNPQLMTSPLNPPTNGCSPNSVTALARMRLLLMPNTSVACHRSVPDSHNQFVHQWVTTSSRCGAIHLTGKIPPIVCNLLPVRGHHRLRISTLSLIYIYIPIPTQYYFEAILKLTSLPPVSVTDRNGLFIHEKIHTYISYQQQKICPQERLDFQLPLQPYHP